MDNFKYYGKKKCDRAETQKETSVQVDLEVSFGQEWVNVPWLHCPSHCITFCLIGARTHTILFYTPFTGFDTLARMDRCGWKDWNTFETYTHKIMWVSFFGSFEVIVDVYVACMFSYLCVCHVSLFGLLLDRATNSSQLCWLLFSERQT